MAATPGERQRLADAIAAYEKRKSSGQGGPQLRQLANRVEQLRSELKRTKGVGPGATRTPGSSLNAQRTAALGPKPANVSQADWQVVLNAYATGGNRAKDMERFLRQLHKGQSGAAGSRSGR